MCPPPPHPSSPSPTIPIPPPHAHSRSPLPREVFTRKNFYFTMVRAPHVGAALLAPGCQATQPELEGVEERKVPAWRCRCGDGGKRVHEPPRPPCLVACTRRGGVGWGGVGWGGGTGEEDVVPDGALRWALCAGYRQHPFHNTHASAETPCTHSSASTVVVHWSVSSNKLASNLS
jgi:hypothetical protein